MNIFACFVVSMGVSLGSKLTNKNQGYKVYASSILLGIDSVLVQRCHTKLYFYHRWMKVHIILYCHQHLILSDFDFLPKRSISYGISLIINKSRVFFILFYGSVVFLFCDFFAYFSIELIVIFLLIHKTVV